MKTMNRQRVLHIFLSGGKAATKSLAPILILYSMRHKHVEAPDPLRKITSLIRATVRRAVRPGILATADERAMIRGIRGFEE